MAREIGTVTGEEIRRWPVRVALFDIDGTLVHGTNSIPVRVSEQIDRVQRAGVKVCLATGRPFFSARWVAERFNCDQPGMFCSGSLVCRPLSGEILFADYLQASETAPFMAVMHREEFYLELYDRDRYYIAGEHEFSRVHEKYMNISPTIGQLKDVAVRHDLLKLVVMVRRGEREQRLREILKEFPNYAVGISSGQADPEILFFNLTNATASREKAFEFFLNHYQVSADQVAAFGDAESDAAFLSMARYGVAMGNAVDEIKQLAPFITGHVRDGGVADALQILIP